jgi:hypothetical protein
MLQNLGKNIKLAVRDTEKGHNAISAKKKKIDKINFMKPSLTVISPEVNEHLFDPITLGGEEGITKNFETYMKTHDVEFNRDNANEMCIGMD